MATLEQRLNFAREHITDKSKRKYSTKNREWVIDEFMRPVDGFKLWPKVPGRICESCSPRVGEIVERWNDAPPPCSEPAMNGDEKCGGLGCEPVVLSVLLLPRRSGKTFNTAAYVLSQLFQEKNKRIGFIASSEDQMLSIFRENYAETIERNPALSKNCKVRASRASIVVPRTGSMFEGMSTSHSGVTGRGRTMLVLDEARDLDSRTIMALLPSVYEARGHRCPNGHVNVGPNEQVPDFCPACKAQIEPWFGRIVIMSSAGLLTGNVDKDWFAELVEHTRANPSPNVHLYEATEVQNPDVSEEIRGTISDVFGSLESTRSLVSVEVENRFTRKGESLLSKAQINACVDNGLRNKTQSERDCVAFLDTSKTVDKTSLVILSNDETRSVDPWGHVVIERIDVWEPQKLPGGVINPADILAHLDMYVPLFPNLRALRVDTRVMPWAVAMVQKAKRERPWGRVVDGWHGKKAERQSSWTLLHQRLMARSIRIPPHAELRQELLTVRKVTDLEGRMDIRDQRSIRHVDIAESLACCCLLAHMESLVKRRSFADTVGKADMSTTLKRLYRPKARGIDLGKF